MHIIWTNDKPKNKIEELNDKISVTKWGNPYFNFVNWKMHKRVKRKKYLSRGLPTQENIDLLFDPILVIGRISVGALLVNQTT